MNRKQPRAGFGRYRAPSSVLDVSCVMPCVARRGEEAVIGRRLAPCRAPAKRRSAVRVGMRFVCGNGIA